MKTNRVLLIVIFAALVLYVLTSFKKTEKETYNLRNRPNSSIPGGNRIVKEYYDGRTFYVLLDYNGKAVNFIEKR
jgi:hypothetical protein